MGVLHRYVNLGNGLLQLYGTAHTTFMKGVLHRYVNQLHIQHSQRKGVLYRHVHKLHIQWSKVKTWQLPILNQSILMLELQPSLLGQIKTNFISLRQTLHYRNIKGGSVRNLNCSSPSIQTIS